MTVRPMKFHIYGTDHEPIWWENKALEFDTSADAIKFLNSLERYYSNQDFSKAIIKEDVLYYDGGYINATGCEYIVDAFGNEFIVEVKYK